MPNENYSKQFTVEAGPMLFDMLSSKIYPHPELAIVRELSTNAFDAHVEAINDHSPFDVHIPTYEEPYFSIRDYGTGMSHETVDQIYTRFFNSTRREDIDSIGQLGLGSKAPIVYVNKRTQEREFKVTSIQDSYRTSYRIYVNENGIPAIEMDGDPAPTSEKNGVFIKIPVNLSDINLFQDAARKIYRWFTVRPNFIGSFNPTPDPQILYKHDDFEIHNDNGRTLNVVMGQISYRVDAVSVNCPVDPKGSIYLKVPRKSCTITPSREHFQYDQKTIDVIKNAFENMKVVLAKELETKVANEPRKFFAEKAKYDFSQLLKILRVNDGFLVKHDAGFEVASVRRGGRQKSMLSIGISTIYFSHESHFLSIPAFALTPKELRNLNYFVNGVKGNVYLVKGEAEDVFGKLISVYDLPQAPRAPRGSNGPRQKVKTFYKNSGGSFQETDEIPADGSFVIKVQRRGGYYDYVEQVKSIIGDKPVYGISSDIRYDRLVEKHKLVSLQSFVQKKCEEFVNTITPEQSQAFHTSRTSLEFLKPYMQNTQFKDQIEQVLQTQLDPMISIARRHGFVIPKSKCLEEQIYERYPLLSGISSHLYESMKEHIISYIGLIDENKNLHSGR